MITQRIRYERTLTDFHGVEKFTIEEDISCETDIAERFRSFRSEVKNALHPNQAETYPVPTRPHKFVEPWRWTTTATSHGGQTRPARPAEEPGEQATSSGKAGK
jgi:hypothetical protein